jgi:hypothetical protein
MVNELFEKVPKPKDPKMKKGQIKIQQMAFMLVAVFIFFVLVGLFVLTFRFSGLKRSAVALEERNALLLVTKLANSPEFSCGESFGNKVNCIDGDKVMVLKDSINKYFGFWGVSNIIIRKSLAGGVECNRGNYPDCDFIDVFSKGAKGYPVENFVTLCIKDSESGEVYDNCEIGKLIVYYNEEQ